MKTILITGANTGIGLATAETFVKDGHHVILACRNPDKQIKPKNSLMHLVQEKLRRLHST